MNHEPPDRLGPRSAEPVEPPVADDRRLSVEELFAGRQEVRLLFGNEEYRLRITRNRKLILTE